MQKFLANNIILVLIFYINIGITFIYIILFFECNQLLFPLYLNDFFSMSAVFE